MFVKKLVEKASKKPGGHSDSLKARGVDPRLVFHYGIPSGSTMFAYDSIQRILAISTKDGRIKLFGKDNTQALLESSEAAPSKFLQFMENQGILLNVTFKNHIEVWDIDKKLLAHVHSFREQITSFTVIQHSLCMYIGDSAGNVSVLRVDQEPCHLVQMNYTIPLSASFGCPSEGSCDTAVVHVLPQPPSESTRVLIIFADGLITLWEIRESKSIFTTGGNKLQPQYTSNPHDIKKVTSACWACPFGSKVVVGYSNGDIFIWSIPHTSNSRTELTPECVTQTAPISKLNLGYKLDKIPIVSLKWDYADGKASRLYVLGASDFTATNLLQVILLNEHTESRTIKLGLHLLEPCIDMEIISSSNEHNKHKENSFLLLGKSGHLYAYDDCLIEKYLLQCQSRSPTSLPKEVMVKMPFVDSSITAAKFFTDNPYMLSSSDEEYIQLAKNIPLLPFETKPKDGTHLNSTNFSGFMKVKNLYITGHSNGAINFWDVSCPFLIPIFSLKQQSENDSSLSGIPVTALFFDGKSRVLVSGDQSGMVRIFKFKAEPYATESSFMSLQGSTKKGNNHIIHSIKLTKVNGSVLSINIDHSSRHLAVGSEQGYVSLINIEGHTLVYQNHIASEICTGVISLQFETCSLHGFKKNVLVVATKDSSVLALDRDTGNTLSTNMVHPKKPSRALFMQILDGRDTLFRENISNGLELGKGNLVEDAIPKQGSILLCLEKAVYVYSLMHTVQGVKKVLYKKKFQSSSCFWASTYYGPAEFGLILLFISGKIEIRSLPELSLVKETSIRGFTYSASKSSSSDISICCSSNGELLMVSGDQEVSFVSVLLQKDIYRVLDSVSQVYRKDLMLSQEGLASRPIVHKEKKKGIFGSVMKGGKTKDLPAVETEDVRESIKELLTTFSTANFPSDAEKKDNPGIDENDVELNIDDIDLEDPGDKTKEPNMLAVLNTQKLTSKFHAVKGKWKQLKIKNDKNSTKEEQQDEKAGAVDQIKRKYGFSLSGESSAKLAESKLHENSTKLQGISLRATAMQDTAKSFSSLAKEYLRTAEDK